MNSLISWDISATPGHWRVPSLVDWHASRSSRPVEGGCADRRSGRGRVFLSPSGRGLADPRAGVAGGTRPTSPGRASFSSILNALALYCFSRDGTAISRLVPAFLDAISPVAIFSATLVRPSPITWQASATLHQSRSANGIRAIFIPCTCTSGVTPSTEDIGDRL